MEYYETNHQIKDNEKIINYWTDEQYFKDRLDKELEYFNSKAVVNKKKYRRFKRLEFILAASIPVVISLSTMGMFEDVVLWNIYSVQHVKGTLDEVPFITSRINLSIILQVIAALSGVVLAFINKIIELDEYYKNWKECRVITEKLTNHKILYLTKTEPYDQEEAFPILIRNVENILSEEVRNWQTMQKHTNEHVLRALSAVDSLGSNKTNKTIDTKINTVEDIVTENTEKNNEITNKKENDDLSESNLVQG